jgi:hypothetical protein
LTEQSSAVGFDATVISKRPPGGPTSMAEIGRLLEGTRLGPYQLEQFVGGGGMGAVFRALDTTLDRIVAVKVLSRHQSGDEEMLRRFKNEAQSAARLDHENIGRVHAVGAEDGWHFIVFEFIEGMNLRDVVAETGPFDLARTINVAIQVADALEHAAERDVVHRDIKPSNIIITPAGRARLVDMGLARLHQVTGDQDLTASGMTLGTFDYISPEQARDPRSADVRSDLYSLGCTIFYMLVGRPPFADGTMVQKLLQHQQDAPPALELLRPDVPRRFVAVLERLMAKDPGDRQQRPAELIADLIGVADEEGIDVAGSRSATLPATEPMPLPAGKTGGSVLPWLVPVLGLGAVVGTLWWMSARPRGTASPEREVGAVGGDPAATDEQQVAAGSAKIPWRVVATPVGDRETGTVGEAIRRAADGDTIELAYDGFLDQPPLTIKGRRLLLRAVDGFTPGIRFVPLMAAMPDTPLLDPDAVRIDTGNHSERRWVGCTITAGNLTITNVRLRLADAFATGGAAPALFSLGAGAALTCEDVLVELPESRFDDDTEMLAMLAPAPVAFVLVEDNAGFGGTRRAEVRMTRSSLTGDGLFMEAAGSGEVEVFWSGGRCVTTRQFLVAGGADRAAGEGLALRLSLSQSLFACQGGFARLVDSSAGPLLPRLQVFAEECRFVLPEGRVLLEQSGIEEPDRYRAAIEWLDANSRYEGSNIFRRIDGSAERVEMDFAASPQPLVHSSRITSGIEGWSETTGWDDGDP